MFAPSVAFLYPIILETWLPNFPFFFFNPCRKNYDTLCILPGLSLLFKRHNFLSLIRYSSTLVDASPSLIMMI